VEIKRVDLIEVENKGREERSRGRLINGYQVI
jgi:hypothetical protein